LSYFDTIVKKYVSDAKYVAEHWMSFEYSLMTFCKYTEINREKREK